MDLYTRLPVVEWGSFTAHFKLKIHLFSTDHLRELESYKIRAISWNKMIEERKKQIAKSPKSRSLDFMGVPI